MKIKLFQNIIDILRGKKHRLLMQNKHLQDEEIANITHVLNSITPKNFRIKKINIKEKNIIFSNKNFNILTDFGYPWIVKEVYGEEIYKFKSNVDETKKYTVLDMGANRGYASVYFAQKDYVKNIYAFELVPQTFDFMQKNINLNPKYKNKIHTYCFGLGKENTKIQINRLENRDGCNTINIDFIDSYMPEEKNNGIPQECKIKKVSEILKEILQHKNESIILKIDVEGAEYDIIDDLIENYPEIFNYIVKIVGETHLGFDEFYNKIKDFGFKVDWKNPQENGTCLFEISKS